MSVNAVDKKCTNVIVCEYLANCVECMRLMLYTMYGVDESGQQKQKQREPNDDKDEGDENGNCASRDTTFSVGLFAS